MLLVDFVGKVENIRKDFAKTCRRLDISDSRLPHVNKNAIWTRIPRRVKDLKRIFKEISSRRRRQNTFPHYWDYFDDEFREYVAHLYRRDIAAFGYRF
jgi:hypothetical protein